LINPFGDGVAAVLNIGIQSGKQSSTRLYKHTFFKQGFAEHQQAQGDYHQQEQRFFRREFLHQHESKSPERRAAKQLLTRKGDSLAYTGDLARQPPRSPQSIASF